MRYYSITIPGVTFSSLANGGMVNGEITSLRSDGSTNPAALNVELDITQYPGHQAGGDSRSYVRIWGLSLADLGRGYDLAGKEITVKVGMAQGYPLANPAQQGTIISGNILQAFGNWLGTEQTLDIILGPSQSGAPSQSGESTPPVNITFTWKKGQKLSDLINQVVQQIYGQGAQIDSSIQVDDTAGNRVAKQDMQGSYTSVTGFAQMIWDMTCTQGKQDGVALWIDGKKFRAFETDPKSGSTSGSIKQISFNDLLGQVTWYKPNSVTAKLVMRGDLVIGDTVKFPDQLVSTVTSASMPAFGGTGRTSDSISFSGTNFTIIQMQHWGNFRQPDAMAWNTTLWLIAPSLSASGGGSS